MARLAPGRPVYSRRSIGIPPLQTTIEEGVFVRTRLVRLLMVGALTFGLFRSTASAAALETLRALPAAQQRPAPAFTLPDLHGTSTRLADMRGKVVVVRFWVTW
jgi:hypothetical protein